MAGWAPVKPEVVSIYSSRRLLGRHNVPVAIGIESDDYYLALTAIRLPESRIATLGQGVGFRAGLTKRCRADRH